MTTILTQPIYKAEFVTSKKEGRMGIKINTYCQHFVNNIKKFQNARYQEADKTWFFDAVDCGMVRDLVIDSFVSPVRVIEINGENEVFHLPEDYVSLGSLSNDGESW